MNRSVIIATIIAVGVTGWIASGQFGDTSNSEAVAKVASETDSEIAPALRAKKTGPTEVQVHTYVARERTQEVIIRGRTETLRSVDIRAETPGRVTETRVDIGQRVKKGDILVKFAVKDRLAQLAEAEALVRQRQIEYKASKALNKKGFSAKTTLASYKALLDSAHAQAKSVRIRLDDLIIRAPFDGIIEERAAEIGDFLKDGNVIITIVDEDPFLVTGQISELYVNKLQVGNEGTAKLITGEEVTGKIRFIGKTADAATRTFRVELLVSNTDGKLRSGVTAETTFKTEKVQAHFISPAFLTLDDEGTLGVRSVNDQDIVQFHPIKVISDSNEGAWVTGLPSESRLIVVGQEFVRAGDTVIPRTVTAGVQ
ncbi:MAG: efflux RND transporter periplasmic adaptor subunit [Sneathiella sp.]|nr:efflux RND transporter periplasmic adaptor subunit [Sneathiella sp.]